MLRLHAARAARCSAVGRAALAATRAAAAPPQPAAAAPGAAAASRPRFPLPLPGSPASCSSYPPALASRGQQHRTGRRLVATAAAPGTPGAPVEGARSQDVRLVCGVTLHCRIRGPPDGPLLVFLHGFPEFWYSWRRQIDFFAELGYLCVAPDMRGYNLSDKPEGVSSYNGDRLALDVKELVTALGRERMACLVGHDWGGAVAWLTALRHPDVVQKLAVVNCAHPEAFAREVMGGKVAQLRRSWYIAAFQVPVLPEFFLRLGLQRLFMAADLVDKSAFSEEDFDRYMDAIRREGAATATVNYYRAAGRAAWARVRGLSGGGGVSDVLKMPTMMLWGTEDAYFSPFLKTRESIEDLVEDLTFEEISNVSHWVQAEASPELNARLEGFLSREGGVGG